MKKQIQNKKLKQSSRTWLQRQLNDPYVERAKKEGYRSRAAFKILEIQEKFKIIKKNDIVIDLGAAPGGWSQIASKMCKKVVAIDLIDMDSFPNVDFIKGDFLDETSIEKIKAILPTGKADVILSDMAPNTCGIKKVDHLRIMNLVEAVIEFAKETLNIGGNMVAKVFQGGTESELLKELKKHFEKIVHFKPQSSRKDSSEIYLIALGFREIDSIFPK
jgi:23S rRNA (uridine2552-2'-O)-methyltransferase